MIQRIGLLLAAVVFAVVGIGFLLVPVQWAAIVDIRVPTPTARTDLRATYGGFDLGIGLFLGLCALRKPWIRPGLAAVGLAGAGYGGGRLVGILPVLSWQASRRWKPRPRSAPGSCFAACPGRGRDASSGRAARRLHRQVRRQGPAAHPRRAGGPAQAAPHGPTDPADRSTDRFAEARPAPPQLLVGWS